MAKATILFAENDHDFLKARSEFLEQEGYLVVPASDPTEARRKLEVGGIDLAIVDIRLVDDDDERDSTGLILAKEVARTVPKIILTGFPSYEYVREALKPQVDELPVAVGFVAKQEGPEALLSAIRKALSAPRGQQVANVAPETGTEMEQDEGPVMTEMMHGAETSRRRWLLVGAFASLVLGTGTGIGAAVSGDFRLLLGAFVFAFLMIASIVVWIFYGE